MPRSADVDAYMAALDHPMGAQVETLRSAILEADERIKESIKWNAPSFYIDDHFATFNLHYPNRVQVVLHAGAKVNPVAKQFEVADPAALLKWAAADRAIVTFDTASEVEERLAAFQDIVRHWVSLTTLETSPSPAGPTHPTHG